MSFGKILDIFSNMFKTGTPTKTPDVIEDIAPEVINNVIETKIEFVSIPERDLSAVTGSQFIRNNLNLTGSIREQNIITELTNGNVPGFLRDLKEITVTNSDTKITYYVMSDYICIGSNENYVRIPMTPLSAQIIADKFECILPTKKMVNDIWKAAAIKLTPLPWGPPFDASMGSTYRYGEHSKRIQDQLANKDRKSLIAGHKKDVVLTNRLAPNNPKKRVAIYGWFNSDGTAIQGLNPTSHEDTYADYSHGLRFISKKILVNGEIKDITDVLKDPKLSILLSDEGILNFLRY